MKKALKNLQNLKKLFEEHGTAELDFVGMNIGAVREMMSNPRLFRFSMILAIFSSPPLCM